MPKLTLDRIYKGYGSRCVIRNATATLDVGAHLLEGGNGVGKSTLLSIVAGTLKPTGGNVFLDGKDIVSRYSGSGPRVAFVPAEPAFFEGISVISALRLYLALRGDVSVHDPLKESDPFDLRQVSEVRFGDLSLGWRKRVLLHMALVPDTDLVILDEPTVGLDQSSVEILAEMVDAKRSDRVLVLTCHEPASLASANLCRHLLESTPGGSILRS